MNATSVINAPLGAFFIARKFNAAVRR